MTTIFKSIQNSRHVNFVALRARADQQFAIECSNLITTNRSKLKTLWWQSGSNYHNRVIFLLALQDGRFDCTECVEAALAGMSQFPSTDDSQCQKRLLPSRGKCPWGSKAKTTILKSIQNFCHANFVALRARADGQFATECFIPH